jgi:hypothetical protein
MAAVQSITKARELGAKIQTAKQANDAIILTLKTLRAAIDIVTNFSLADKAAGVVKAYASRIEQQIARVGVLQKRAYDRKLADAVGLAVVQSAALLSDLRRDVGASQAESTVRALADEFARALREILAAAIETAAQAIPWYVWAGLAYLLLKDD